MPTNLSVATGIGCGNNPYALPNGAEPFVVIDLENGVYMVGTTVQTLNQVLTEDSLNWNSYNPADVNSVPGGGYAPESAGPVVTGDALAYLIQGKTFIFDFTVNGATQDNMRLSMFNEEFSFASDWYLGAGSGRRATFVGFPEPTVSWPSGVDTPLSTGRHKAAITHIDGYMAWSIDGGEVQASVTEPWAPAPTLFGFFVESEAFTAIVHSLNVYPEQDVADLPTLSTP